MAKATKGDTPTRRPAPTHEPAPLATWRAGFLVALGTTGNASQAAQAVSISRGHAYRVRAENEDFAQEWAEALQVATDALETEARKLATGAYWSYKFDKHGAPLVHPETGEPYRERVVHPGLLHVLLKAHRPELFGDKLKVEQATGSGKYDLSKLSPEQLAQLEALTQAAAVQALPDAA